MNNITLLLWIVCMLFVNTYVLLFFILIYRSGIRFSTMLVLLLLIFILIQTQIVLITSYAIKSKPIDTYISGLNRSGGILYSSHGYASLGKLITELDEKALEQELEIKSQIKKLNPQWIVFNPPDEMKVGIEERIEARIAKSITRELTLGLQRHEKVQVKKIEVGRIMSVQLEGDKFDIKNLAHMGK